MSYFDGPIYLIIAIAAFCTGFVLGGTIEHDSFKNHIRCAELNLTLEQCGLKQPEEKIYE